MKRKYFLALCIIMIGSYGCKKHDNDCPTDTQFYCSTANSLEDKSFLATLVANNPTGRGIWELTYNCKQGYLIIDSPIDATHYTDCAGNELYQNGGVRTGNYPNDFDSKTSYKKQIYPQ
jgi:hypothetical protein